MYNSWNDTIIALATPPGVGAIGVIRLSGPDAIKIADVLLWGKNLHSKPSHTAHVGLLKHQGVSLDEALVTIFRSPRSYTGEDVAEISCHGSPYILHQVLDAGISLGARLAKPGEFTQRAFLKGKMDLTQAEAVADLIASGSSAAQKTALHALRGGFSDILKSLRERLITFSALIELELDFSQEDVEFADRTQLINLVEEAQHTTDKLLDSFQLGNAIRQGVSVAIVGKPNAGKSTLLNTLLNENRAIVSEIAGTTRDTIEEILNIDGILFRLIDTAGIRESKDVIESIGVERSYEKLKAADIVVYLFDVNTESVSELSAMRNRLLEWEKQYLLVGNKSDLPGEGKAGEKYAGYDVLFIAAKTHHHIDLLKERLVDLVLRGKVESEDTLVTNVRHYEALKEVRKSLQDISKGIADKLPGDLLALDIRRCLFFLGEITGEITNEDKLDYIFSKFCIGK